MPGCRRSCISRVERCSGREENERRGAQTREARTKTRVAGLPYGQGFGRKSAFACAAGSGSSEVEDDRMVEWFLNPQFARRGRPLLVSVLIIIHPSSLSDALQANLRWAGDGSSSSRPRSETDAGSSSNSFFCCSCAVCSSPSSASPSSSGSRSTSPISAASRTSTSCSSDDTLSMSDTWEGERRSQEQLPGRQERRPPGQPRSRT